MLSDLHTLNHPETLASNSGPTSETYVLNEQGKTIHNRFSDFFITFQYQFCQQNYIIFFGLIQTRVVESKSLKVVKNLKIGKNRI